MYFKIVLPHVGSSPRMRGAQGLEPVEFTAHRIIPADAGSTCPLLFSRPACRDHPRGCGEHSEIASL